MLATSDKTIENALGEINLATKGKFYDLGSGNGKVAFRFAATHPNFNCIGIEFNLAAYFSAKIRNIFSKHKISCRRENFFKVNLDDADIVYTYLFPDIMKELEQKFNHELKKGATVIANTFPLQHKSPIKIIQSKTGKLGTLYIYKY